MIIANGITFCEDGIFRKINIETAGNWIASLDAACVPDKEPCLDVSGCYVVPGFVEIHIHGAMNADFSDGTKESIDTIAKFLLSRGVTSFLGTSMALPEDRLAAIYKAANPVFNKPIPEQAVLRGINMEGPFFSKEKRGAQNEAFIIDADYEMFSRLNKLSGGKIRTVAVAPEISGGLEFIKRASKDCSVSLAHSCADYDTAAEAFASGADHVTHLFNGMLPFDHRNPGIIGAAADAGVYAELISDGLHLHPSMIRSVFGLFGDERICLISDAMRACGMPDGQYDLGGQNVIVEKNAARIDTGSLAGSVTVLTDCFRRAVQFGIPLESALKAVTANPAKSVGLYDTVGSLSTGKQADILVLNRDLTLRHIILGGELQ